MALRQGDDAAGLHPDRAKYDRLFNGIADDCRAGREEADDESRRDDATGEDAPFVSDERVDEGWTATPIGHKPGEPIPADFDPYEDDDDDDDDPPFYTEEDYRNMPVLRRILQDLGGEDPLVGEDADGDDGDADKE